MSKHFDNSGDIPPVNSFPQILPNDVVCRPHPEKWFTKPFYPDAVLQFTDADLLILIRQQE